MSVNIIVGAYGGLSLIAAVLQAKYKNISLQSGILMGLGGLLMIVSLFLTGYLSVGVFVVGAIMAHISAIINGLKMHGQVNKSHHIARFVITIILLSGMYFSRIVS